MNPPIRDENHQMGIWKGVKEKVIDVLVQIMHLIQLMKKTKISKVTIRNDWCANIATYNAKFC